MLKVDKRKLKKAAKDQGFNVEFEEGDKIVFSKDEAPLIKSLNKMIAQNNDILTSMDKQKIDHPVKWKCDVERDRGGLIESFTLTPIYNTSLKRAN